MRTNRLMPFALLALALLGLSVLAWTRPAPAAAQDDEKDQPAIAAQDEGMPAPSSAIAANDNYVYVLRGNTVYQMQASDLSLVNKKSLSASDDSKESLSRPDDDEDKDDEDDDKEGDDKDDPDKDDDPSGAQASQPNPL
jgi:hypothetical protein